MPIARSFPSRTGLVFAAALFAASCSSVVLAAPAAVGVVRHVAWSPGDSAREGAGEFSVLLQIAQLQQGGARAGLVGVSARHGVFATGTERALRFAVLSGVPVAKLAPGSEVAASPEKLFVDAKGLNEADAQRVLAAAIESGGAAPRAANPAQPTARELAAIRAYVVRLQQHFTAAQPTLVASR
jgi:hypothetical protein